MTATIPKFEPKEIEAGNTIKWKRSLSDYSAADGWVLTYALRGPSSIDITASNDNGDHLVNVAATTTANYTAGDYWWTAYVTKDGERYGVGEGTLTINENRAAVTGGSYDDRTHVKKVLDALEATILGKASKDQSGYSIQGRSISRMSPEEIIKWRDRYKAEYRKEQQAERIKKGLKSGKMVKVRFTG